MSLSRETRIIVFSRNAVMDRKVFSTKRKISSLCTFSVNSAFQRSSQIVFLLLSSVKFVSSAIPYLRCRYKERFSMNSLFASNFIYSFQIFALTLFLVIHTEFA